MQFDNAFAAIAESKVEAVVATQDGEFAPSFGIIARLCTAKKLPWIGSRRSRQRLSNRSVQRPSIYDLHAQAAIAFERLQPSRERAAAWRRWADTDE
jgi:hypothetical protein